MFKNDLNNIFNMFVAIYGSDDSKIDQNRFWFLVSRPDMASYDWLNQTLKKVFIFLFFFVTYFGMMLLSIFVVAFSKLFCYFVVAYFGMMFFVYCCCYFFIFTLLLFCYLLWDDIFVYFSCCFFVFAFVTYLGMILFVHFCCTYFATILLLHVFFHILCCIFWHLVLFCIVWAIFVG